MQNLLLAVNPLLRNYVKEILVVEDSNASDQLHSFRYFADGSPVIVFHQSENGFLIAEQNKSLDSLFLYGHTLKPITMCVKGKFKMIAFCLTPHGINTLFGINANELNDSCIDITLLHKSTKAPILEQLEQAKTTPDQVAILNDFLIDLALKGDFSATDPIGHAIDAIKYSNGAISFKKLQNTINLTERTFQRKFEQQIGVSPRMYARICKFHTAFQQFKNTDYDKLSDIAYTNGYSDQSHFIRTFKEFTAITPLEFKKKVEKRELYY